MKKFQQIAIVLSLLITSVYSKEPSIYEIVKLTSKECKSSGNSISCQYKIGKLLHISIDGIGEMDTGVTFLKSDIDGDFFATYGIRHGCVIIKSLQRVEDYAFISPKNGKVYKDWRLCKEGN